MNNNIRVCQHTNNVVKSFDMNAPKRRELDESEREDVDRLRLIIEARKLEDRTFTQDKLAEACGWSSQGNIQNYVGYKTPLNLDAAFRFAKALNVPLEKISPRLAAKAVEIFGATQVAKEASQSIDGLLISLQKEVADADADARRAIAEFVKAYKDNPDEGSRIARSILAVLGKL